MCTYFIDIIIFTVYFVSFIYTKQTVKTKKNNKIYNIITGYLSFCAQNTIIEFHRYIRLYGLKFSKEDHITFIKLAYELLLIPDLEPTKIHKFGTMFVILAK